jgi:hypothetical protein
MQPVDESLEGITGNGDASRIRKGGAKMNPALGIGPPEEVAPLLFPSCIP